MTPIILNGPQEAGLLIQAQESGINEMEEVEKDVTNFMTPSKTAHGLAEKKIGRLIRTQGISMIQMVTLMTTSMTSEA
uniref:hypothetical protein n=1 Tax=Pseudomonas aeruginosa TaxID=287 RepID=UPI0018828A15|nr:hypothetical protein [Pseudomonas aeruginosa]